MIALINSNTEGVSATPSAFQRFQQGSNNIKEVEEEQAQKGEQQEERNSDDSSGNSNDESDDDYNDGQASDDSENPRPAKRRRVSHNDSTLKRSRKVRFQLPHNELGRPPFLRYDDCHPPLPGGAFPIPPQAMRSQY